MHCNVHKNKNALYNLFLLITYAHAHSQPNRSEFILLQIKLMFIQSRNVEVLMFGSIAAKTFKTVRITQAAAPVLLVK